MFSFEKVGGTLGSKGYAYIYFMNLWVYSGAVRFKTRHTHKDHRRDYVTSPSASGKLTTLTQKLGISLSFRPQNMMVQCLGIMVYRARSRDTLTIMKCGEGGDRSYERGARRGGSRSFEGGVC